MAKQADEEEEENSSEQMMMKSSARDASSRVALNDASSFENPFEANTLHDASSCSILAKGGSDASSLEKSSVGNILRDASSCNILAHGDLAAMLRDARSRNVLSDASSLDNVRDASSRDVLRDASSRDGVRDASSRDVLRDASSRVDVRDASPRDVLRDASSRDDERDASSRGVLRDASSRDDVREASSRDVPRDARSRDDVREASSRDVPRDARSRDDVREASSRDVPRDARSLIDLCEASSRESDDDSDANKILFDYGEYDDQYEVEVHGQNRNPVSRNTPSIHSPLSPEIARKLVADLSQEDIVNDRFSGVKSTNITFPPHKLLSEHQVIKQEWKSYTWQRLFAMIRVMRLAGVLDNEISWEDTCYAYYRGNRPECFDFSDMTESEDRNLMDNVEDLFQEVFHMRLLDKVPVNKFEHLLSTIPRDALFRHRLHKYDPDIIKKCDVEIILDRREKASRKVFESNPSKRRVKIEMGLINEPIPDNKWRLRDLDRRERESSSRDVRRETSSRDDVRDKRSRDAEREASSRDRMGAWEPRANKETRDSSLSRVVEREPCVGRESRDSSLSEGQSNQSMLSARNKRLRQQEDEIRLQNLEIELLQKKVEGRRKLEALRLMDSEDTERVVKKSDTNTYNKGEIISATVHGQRATIIMDGMGSFSWITLDMVHKLKDARQGVIIKTQGGGDYWHSFHAFIYDFKNPKNAKFPAVFHGRKTVQGYPTAVEMTLLVVKEPLGKVMADIGLHATEYESASSPAESVLGRPASQFPWVLMEKGEGPPRYVRPNVSTRDALLGSPSLSKRLLVNSRESDSPGGHSYLGSTQSHEEVPEPTRWKRKPDEVLVANREYLEHVRFDGDESTGALRYMAEKYGLFVFDSSARPNEDQLTRQAKYAKSTTRQSYKWRAD